MVVVTCFFCKVTKKKEMQNFSMIIVSNTPIYI